MGAAVTWDSPATVEGFVRSPANHMLLQYAARIWRGDRPVRVLDIGCGAGRNAVPLARRGFLVIGTDLSQPMLQAAAARDADGRLRLVKAPMDALPLCNRSCDLIVAHGVWNLAGSGAEFRRAVAEAARVAAADARLFVFTFSRTTLRPDAHAVSNETFVYTDFAGAPQVFLTRDQLIEELARQGFTADPELPLRELNAPPPRQLPVSGRPVIF
ncbi:MAG TPA: class I SAM-dependent methyltransferase, partial [Vicinamibacterales bacterium]|nr:class I SAM-dependent methyltransferase [Vicinamibacterales bacterium]